MKRIILWSLVIGWVIVIFSFSSQRASESDALSKNITREVVEKVESIAKESEVSVETLNHYVRKSAHFFNYMVLGLLIIGALANETVDDKKAFRIGFLLCVLISSLDEFYQSFIPGRGPGVMDVLIDMTGALAGMLLCQIILKYRKKLLTSKFT